jgi:hypothetical protein
MKAATVTNEARETAEGNGNNPSAAAQHAKITGGRTQPPLAGNLRGSGVLRSQNAATEHAVLCNITEQTWILHRTHGAFVVAGRGPHVVPEVPYALTQISARTGAIDLGDKRTLEFPISARDIAEDLAREINADGGESSYFGVFVCAGDEPDADELAEARERLALFYASLVNSADKQWERTHNVAFISDLERRAARELRLEKDWSYEPTMRNECPACGERLKPNVAVCRTCGAVLNRERAAQWGLGAAEVVQRVAEPAKTPSQPRA